jgi:hypothetical protein
MKAGETTAHADAPPVGSVVVATNPGYPWHDMGPHAFPCPTATQNDPDTQETPVPSDACGPSALGDDGNAGDILHALAPPVGSVETSIFPAISTATHNDTEGHEIPANQSPVAVVLHDEAPAAGSVEVTISPPSPTAAQNDTDGHETAVSACKGEAT